MSENMIFCIGEGRFETSGAGYQKNYMAWNKQVTQERYEEIVKEINTILSDFTIDTSKDRKEEWGKVTPEQWRKISEIPEFDLEITKKITGLEEIKIEQEKTIEIEGKKFTISEIKSIIKSAQ